MSSRLLFASVPLLAVLAPPRASEPETAPPEVVAWLADAATPIASVEPGTRDPGLAALRGIVGDARIVGLGEATHGSHEFFAFKARAVEYLVSELGFTDFAMESDWTQGLVVNEWIEHGRGDVDAALQGLSSLWRTEEYRGLLEWLRAWNADPAHPRKVRFHGMDMGNPALTAKRLRVYLARVDPEIEESVAPVIASLAGASKIEESDIEGLLSLFDDLREPFVAASGEGARAAGEGARAAGEREWALHRHHVTILGQTWHQRGLRGHDATSWRDRCMADNVRWILREGGADARVALSAHNGHVSRGGLFEVEGYGTVESIGRALAADAETVTDEDLSMVVIGSAFARGGFHAFGAAGGGLQAFTVGAPRAGAVEEPFLAAGLTRALVDLRTAPAGPARDWLEASHPLRFVGGQFADGWEEEGNDVQPTRLAHDYDALFFVAEATPAKLLNPPR
jgi:erythromycin esterase